MIPELPQKTSRVFVYHKKNGEAFMWYYNTIDALLRHFGRQASSHDTSFTWYDAAVCTMRLRKQGELPAGVRRRIEDAPRRKPR